jgi:hypothetical protein
MGDSVVYEFIAFFVFLGMNGSGRKKEKNSGGEALTSVVTSRFRYSIQTRMGEFIGPECLYYGYDGNLRRRQKLG